MNINIAEALQLSEEKPAVMSIRNTDKLQVAAIGLKKDQVLKKHVTALPALLIVLKGKIAFEMEGTATTLSALNTFEIPANVPHEVTGVEESTFILIKEKLMQP